MADLRFLGEFDRCYCYARVSSVEQAEKRLSIEGQLGRLSSVIPKPDKIYQDVLSGDRKDRQGYLELIDQVKEDAMVRSLRVLVVITEQSRLSREGSDSVTTLIELFDTIGVCLFALDGGKQTVKEPHEWLMRSQEALFNQYFLRQLKRTLRGSKAQKRAEGKPLNTTAPFGYLYTREKLEPNPEQWILARQLVEKYLPHPQGEGLSLEMCARWITSQGFKLSRGGIRSWLLNPVLRGHLEYSDGGFNRDERKAKKVKNKKIIYHTHDALITESEYHSIIARMKDNSRYARKSIDTVRYPLSGLVHCGTCKNKLISHSMTDKRYGGKYVNYHCENRSCTGEMRSASETKIEKLLIVEIAKKAEQIAQNVIDSEIETTDPNLLKLEKELRELRETYEKIPMQEIKNAVSIKELEIQQYTKKPLQKSNSVDFAKVSQKLINPRSYSQLSDEIKRLLYHEIVDKIYVFRLQKAVFLEVQYLA